ncbi:MAG: hypothetical protein IPO71_12885 [Nitrosomonas sp.]|nr:hypothetical protein [Nitrosomonas sp.]
MIKITTTSLALNRLCSIMTILGRTGDSATQSVLLRRGTGCHYDLEFRHDGISILSND